MVPTGERSGPESGAPCSCFVKGGGLLCPTCLEEREGLHIPFPPCNQGRVVPLLKPDSCNAPHCQAHWVVCGAAMSSNTKYFFLKKGS